MKFSKLALATVAAFGLAGVAQADTIVADGLDAQAWTAGDPLGPKTGYTEEGTVGITDGAVWFGGAESDETAVTTYTGVAPYAGTPNANPAFPGGLSTGANYLKVSNSSPLWRMFNPYGKVNDSWPSEFPTGGAVAVADGVMGKTYNGGLFIDTLVQFTPSEDAPTPEEGSKLIVWMNTNGVLCVTAKAITYENDNVVQTKTDFETTTPLVTNTWYRLTVSAFNDVCYRGTIDNPGSGLTVHGFRIYIDGVPVVANQATVSEVALGSDSFAYCYPEVADLMRAKMFFPSLDDLNEVASLSAVGFKGEGLVDDIVVTDVDPFPPGQVSGIDFTLTWGEGVSAVWFAIGTTTNNLDVAGSSFTTNYPSGTFITYGATASAWKYVVPETFELVAATNCQIQVSDATTGGEAGVKDSTLANWTPAQVKAAFGDEITPDALNDATAPYLDYQLGQTLGTIKGEPALKIVDIAESKTAGAWDIKVQVLDGANPAAPIEIDDGDEKKSTPLKASLKVIAADTLEGLASAEADTYDLIFDETATDLTVTVDKGAFFKATIEYIGAPVTELE